MAQESRHHTDYSGRGLAADVTASFAGILLIVVSAFDILQGLSAIANDELYAAGTEYLYKLDMSVWGTVHLITGILGVIVGLGVVARTSWGPVCGMIVAALAMLTNFAFLPVYPFWSILIIAFNGLVIWALSVQARGYRD